MSKEYILAIMEEKTGMLVSDIKVGERLKINVQASDAVIGAEFIAARDNNAEFNENSLETAKSTSKKISDGEETYIPVIIECDMKVTTLDGSEIDRSKLVGKFTESRMRELLKGLLD